MANNPPRQLSLSVALNDAATLANFYRPKGSVLYQVVATLQGGTEPFVYLWGGSGTGVTHLLQAACHQAMGRGLTAQYLPLDELLDYPPSDLLDGMEHMSLVSLDGLQAVAGQARWESALFDFFNRIRDGGNRLLVGANGTPREIGIQLPDLQSRLSWGLTYQLPMLNDAEKVELLCFRAARRGMEISEGVARYVLTHAPRDMHGLIHILECLDGASLEAQRKITVPFIKQVLGIANCE